MRANTYKARTTELVRSLFDDPIRCNPPSGWSPMRGYAYDKGVVTRFDDQRHEIVHGKAPGKPLTLFQVSDESLYYIQRTGMYFLGLINFKYGLQLDLRSFQNAGAAPRLHIQLSECFPKYAAR